MGHGVVTSAEEIGCDFFIGQYLHFFEVINGVWRNYVQGLGMSQEGGD